MFIFALIIGIIIGTFSVYFAIEQSIKAFDEYMLAEFKGTPRCGCDCKVGMMTVNNIPLSCITYGTDVDTQKTFVELDAIEEIFGACNITKESLANGSCCGGAKACKAKPAPRKELKKVSQTKRKK